MHRWQEEGLNIPVSVNLDGYQLQRPGFIDRLEVILARYPEVDASKLELELLESSAVDVNLMADTVINCCNKLGVRFALDDFGTGYSSLTHLRRLPAHVLKIDQSFVRDMLDDEDDLAIVVGVISLAKAFHREVIAEGVETPEHGTLLLELGCELAQGYAIARPMPALDVPLWLSKWRSDMISNNQSDNQASVSVWTRSVSRNLPKGSLSTQFLEQGI
jgi:EAL domain-containing protein (putative c-di-GMP-specific phosphodiesterase class I)